VGSVSGSDVLNCLSNLEISIKPPQTKCFMKKIGGMENNNGAKVVVQSNFRFWSDEKASPFSHSQITK